MERTGGPEVLTVREVPDPEPGAGQVLVDVEAVGVNFRDVYEREGRPPYGGDVPRVVGADGVPLDVAAAVMLQGCTAQYLAADSYPVVAGDWVVVHSAA